MLYFSNSKKIKLEIIFVGRSNVGKSTLFSRLFGKEVKKGKRPGTTIKPNTLVYKDLLVTDLPGYGYIHGVRRDFNERVKDFIVHYIESNAERIICGIHVVDGKSFLEIVERWESRGEIPIDIEMYDFLNEFDFQVFLAVNKMDKVEKKDYTLNAISEKLGMIPPWTNWKHRIFPVSAKKGEVDALGGAIRNVLVQKKRHDLLPVLKTKSTRKIKL
ncbi:putative GTPase [Archaeoglobus sulfaticallidus PM70-1]|uniref:Probable GTP-binding protein EngB n=1 Tax=Archaeoglobus sulfaticallidus PM70-1 TaxID=387631 RepID=N0B9I8_9EURY|nr:GTP-binding protein EngB [Archaeoglobus sulfaticallidus]AGK60269.1 putative GTPase [Archaeoglobus sulfaticallidus PM70-1]